MKCGHKYLVKWVTPERALSEARQALLLEKPVLAFSILNKWYEQRIAQEEIDRAELVHTGAAPCPECPVEVLPGVKVVEVKKSE